MALIVFHGHRGIPEDSRTGESKKKRKQKKKQLAGESVPERAEQSAVNASREKINVNSPPAISGAVPKVDPEIPVPFQTTDTSRYADRERAYPNE